MNMLYIFLPGLFIFLVCVRIVWALGEILKRLSTVELQILSKDALFVQAHEMIRMDKIAADISRLVPAYEELTRRIETLQASVDKLDKPTKS